MNPNALKHRFNIALLFVALVCTKTVSAQTADSLLQTGVREFRLRHLKIAMDYLNRSIALDSTNAYAWQYRGNAKNLLADYKGALGDYTRAIELNPAYSYAYNERGLAKLKTGDKDGACDDFVKASDLNLPDAWNNKYRYCRR